MLLGIGSGCALSPQTVALTPFINVASHPVGRDRKLALEVVDMRPSPAFGTRGGVYDTAEITPRANVAQVVRQALAERLTASQFVVTAPNPGAPISMRVEILGIFYTASGKPMITEVRAGATVRAITRNGKRTLTSQYEAKSVRQTVGAPSEAENETILNEVLAQALQRMMQDNSIWELLAQ